MPDRYVVDIRVLDGAGHLVRTERVNAGDSLEPARAVLAGAAEIYLDTHPETYAIPDPVTFMDRPNDRSIRIFPGRRELAVWAAELVDTTRKHCRSCACTLIAR